MMIQRERRDGPGGAGVAILVGTDFSEGAAAACREARALSEQLGGSVELLHVVRIGDERRGGHPAEWLCHAGAEGAELVTRTGEPWVQIVRRAAEISAALVVVGAHGASGFQTLAPGSTTARLLVQSAVPVMVVPPRTIQPPNRRKTR